MRHTQPRTGLQPVRLALEPPATVDHWLSGRRHRIGVVVVAAMIAAVVGLLPLSAAAAPASRAARPQTVHAFKIWARFHVGSHQFRALNNIWVRESGWNRHARNPSSGAYGIPQAVPGSKMRSAGADWTWNGYTQMRWGLRYIRSRYGSAVRAWRFWCRHHWY